MHFVYQAVLPSGQFVTHHAQAPSAKRLTEQLVEQNYQIVEMRVDWRRNLTEGFSKPRIKRPVLIDFFNYMRGMLELGMNVTTAITTVKDTLEDKVLLVALEQVEDLVNKGYGFGDALEQTDMFPGLTVASVKAAEKANRLEQVFLELANHYQNLDDLVRQAKKAATYPSIALVVLSGVFAMLLFVVIPQLADILPPDRPLITRVMIWMSEMAPYIWWIPFVTVGVIFFTIRSLTPAQKARIGVRIYRLPVVGRVGLNLELSTVFMSLAMLNGGGIPLLETLRVASTVTSSLFIREKLNICRELAAQGSPLSEGFRDPIFPPVVLRAIAHGEATGRFDAQFAGIAKFLRERTANQLDLLSNFIEPVMIVFGGGMLMLMALGIFMPIYQNISNFGR